MTSGISIAEVQSAADIEDMRTCRNQVRQFMTHNSDEISAEEQMQWHLAVYTPLNDMGLQYGYVVRDGEEALGYGLVTRLENKWWVTGGLIEAARGKHIGQLLFEFLTMKIHEDLKSDEAWLDVLNDNSVARCLYEKLGYVAVDANDDLTEMVHRQPEQEAA